MTFLEESKKRFDEKFPWLSENKEKEIWYKPEAFEAFLASEIQRFANEAIKKIGNERYAGNHNGHTDDDCLICRFNKGLSLAQDILKGMRG